MTELPDNLPIFQRYSPQMQRHMLLTTSCMGLIHSQPSTRELRIGLQSANRDPAKLYEFLSEAILPPHECAHRMWRRFHTDEGEIAAIITARLNGFMPPELIEDAARGAAAVVAGAELTIRRKPKEQHARG